MRIILQNVLDAKVEVEGKVTGKIARGWLLLVGFSLNDNNAIVKKMADKLLTLRVFPDENGKTNKSLSDIGGEILSVSQFTLYGDVRHGRRPSFTDSAPYERGQVLYNLFNGFIEDKCGRIATGIYGADMKVTLVNDGPFTLILDSEDLVDE
ncbi:MAG TPA: D-aminoacyl-tRNA deacylase [Bacilli bacterium]|nr:D-aminoacyl-tRNA deacylase [Bacilli bacterium]